MHESGWQVPFLLRCTGGRLETQPRVGFFLSLNPDSLSHFYKLFPPLEAWGCPSSSDTCFSPSQCVSLPAPCSRETSGASPHLLPALNLTDTSLLQSPARSSPSPAYETPHAPSHWLLRSRGGVAWLGRAGPSDARQSMGRRELSQWRRRAGAELAVR